MMECRRFWKRKRRKRENTVKQKNHSKWKIRDRGRSNIEGDRKRWLRTSSFRSNFIYTWKWSLIWPSPKLAPMTSLNDVINIPLRLYKVLYVPKAFNKATKCNKSFSPSFCVMGKIEEIGRASLLNNKREERKKIK